MLPCRASAVVASVALLLGLTVAGPVPVSTPSAVARSASPPMSAPVVARAAYTPTPTALFSRPGLSSIRASLLAAIDNTPRGERIRGVTFTFDDTGISAALLAAHRRGAIVQVLVARKTKGTQAVRDLVAGLRSPSYVVWSGGSARKSAGFDESGAMHQKSWSFTRTGTADDVSIITSANATVSAYTAQYNDGWRFVEYAPVRATLDRMFVDQVRRTTWSAPYRVFTFSAATELRFSPWNSPTMTDPVVTRINQIPARGAVIRVANAAWSGSRGLKIAQALAAKKRAGANVLVLASEPFADAVCRTLRSARIPIGDAHWGESRYLHSKFMTASYVVDGRRTKRLWTGSENWGDAPRAADEISLKVGNVEGHDAYVRNFDYIRSLTQPVRC